MQTFDVTSPAAQFQPSPLFREPAPEPAFGDAGDAEAYALIKQGPAVPPEEVESATVQAAEVMVLWGTNVLHVAHLAPPRPFSVGEVASGACDYSVPREVLGVDRLPLLVGDETSPRLVIPAGATGCIEAPGQPRLAIEEARNGMAPSSSVVGGHEFPLRRGVRVRMQLNGLTFQVAMVNAGRPVKRGLLAVGDWSAAGYFGASFMTVGAVMAAMAFFVPDLGLVDEAELDRERLYLINAILQTEAERERDKQDTPQTSDQDSDEGGTGDRSKSDEGTMGKQTSRQTNKHYAMKGAPDNADPHLARMHGREEATTFGMIAILSGADPDAPTAPWGRDTAMGLDDLSAQGNMWGDEIGDAFGSGGLGLSGLGEGAGGNGLGIGLGDIGLGHGAGLGLRQGFGNGVGRQGGSRSAGAPSMRPAGETSVSGRLPPEVIQRIVRQNYGRFRMCYERGLVQNPNLAGRVAVRFAIGQDGRVMTAQNGGSDLPDSSVVGCVVSAFYGVTFPQPDNGIVTVSYPIMFSPG